MVQFTYQASAEDPNHNLIDPMVEIHRRMKKTNPSLLISNYQPEKTKREREREMGPITAAVVAIAAVILGWISIEIACKPCLDRGREAIDRSLDPNYDPDSPRFPSAVSDSAAAQPLLDSAASSTSADTKVI